MSEFNFKSQICTSRFQSERLLALGLKKETADMTHHYMYSTDDYELKDIEFSRIMHLQELVNKKPVLGRSGDDLYAKDVPAWSLHRLLSMLPDDAPRIYWILDGANITIYFEDDCGTFFPYKGDIYEGVVNCIEWLIKEGYFPKEYLEE